MPPEGTDRDAVSAGIPNLGPDAESARVRVAGWVAVAEEAGTRAELSAREDCASARRAATRNHIHRAQNVRQSNALNAVSR